MPASSSPRWARSTVSGSSPSWSRHAAANASKTVASRDMSPEARCSIAWRIGPERRPAGDGLLLVVELGECVLHPEQQLAPGLEPPHFGKSRVQLDRHGERAI